MTCSVQDRKTVAGAQALAEAHGVAQREITQVTGPVGGATPSLLAAALSGLLCLSGCGSDDPAQPKSEQDGSAGDPSQGSDAGAGDPTHDAGANLTPDAAGGDAATGGNSTTGITLSRVDKTVTEESFRAQCEELHGTFEVHPSCGGANSCRGMSYDLDTQVYTEHTCHGLNTCRGFSCVLP